MKPIKLKYDSVKDEIVEISDKVQDALFELPDGEYTVVIDKQKKDRSTPQNKYYWGVVLKMLSDFTGYDAEELHNMMKSKFNLVHVDFEMKNPTISTSGDRITYGGSTAKLTTTDFENYLEKIRMWASQYLSLYIPEPNRTDWV